MATSTPRFEGNVAVITGASMGIGRAIGLSLARQGAVVLGVARGREDLDRFKQEVGRLSPKSDVFAADVSDSRAVDEMIEFARVSFGCIDILINNAGVEDRRSILQTSQADVDRVMAVNFGGMVNVTLAALPGMVEQHHGRIVNVVSGAGRSPFACEAAYCASKAAITAFSEAISYELEPLGVRVQVLYPGHVPTTRMSKEAATAGQTTPTRAVQRTAEQVADVLLRGLRSDAFEINAANLERLAPIVRSVAPRLYRRQIARAQPA